MRKLIGSIKAEGEKCREECKLHRGVWKVLHNRDIKDETRMDRVNSVLGFVFGVVFWPVAKMQERLTQPIVDFVFEAIRTVFKGISEGAKLVIEGTGWVCGLLFQAFRRGMDKTSNPAAPREGRNRS